MKRISVAGGVGFLVCMALVGISGCSGKRNVTVSGKIILPDNVKVAANDSVSLSFLPEDKADTAAKAPVSNSDLSFTTKQAVPGKVKVAVKIETYMGDPKAAARAGQFEKLNKKYGDSNKTPLTYEVTADPNQSITVDLKSDKVTKQ